MTCAAVGQMQWPNTVTDEDAGAAQCHVVPLYCVFNVHLHFWQVQMSYLQRRSRRHEQASLLTSTDLWLGNTMETGSNKVFCTTWQEPHALDATYTQSTLANLHAKQTCQHVPSAKRLRCSVHRINCRLNCILGRLGKQGSRVHIAAPLWMQDDLQHFPCI